MATSAVSRFFVAVLLGIALIPLAGAEPGDALPFLVHATTGGYDPFPSEVVQLARSRGATVGLLSADPKSVELRFATGSDYEKFMKLEQPRRYGVIATPIQRTETSLEGFDVDFKGTIERFVRFNARDLTKKRILVDAEVAFDGVVWKREIHIRATGSGESILTEALRLAGLRAETENHTVTITK